jgi:hypothetical protein
MDFSDWKFLPKKTTVFFGKNCSKIRFLCSKHVKIRPAQPPDNIFIMF